MKTYTSIGRYGLRNSSCSRLLPSIDAPGTLLKRLARDDRLQAAYFRNTLSGSTTSRKMRSSSAVGIGVSTARET
jgi:hypothetical protein